MSVGLRALLMTLIFAGSIMCKVCIYSEGQISSKNPFQISYLAAEGHRSNGEKPVRCYWNRLFKFKRRIEKYGLIQKAVSPHPLKIFYSVEKIFGLLLVHEPPLVILATIFQPPRSLSIS